MGAPLQCDFAGDSIGVANDTLADSRHSPDACPFPIPPQPRGARARKGVAVSSRRGNTASASTRAVAGERKYGGAEKVGRSCANSGGMPRYATNEFD